LAVAESKKPKSGRSERGETFSGEDSRVGRRVRRYAQVGSSVGGLAAQLVGSRVFGRDLDRLKHSSELKEALGGLKGPLMKAAQILATIPDALPREYAEELRQLQSNAPAMGWPFVKRRMRTELGADWQENFTDFTHEAAAAASLGQVHQAHDEAGRLLACKLQYPEMSSTVEADLQQLKWIFTLYRQYDRAIDTSLIFKELSERLREELDYEREGRHMRLYEAMLADIEGVEVPEVEEALTTRRLLTMTWLEGKPLLKFIEDHPDEEMRNRVAMNMFHAWYVPFYRYGVIHGDPHLGNYSITPEGGVNLLDFGCIRVFRPAFVKGVIDLYHALERKDDALAREAYASWGFENLSDELLETLNIWASFLYAPLLSDKVQPIMGEENSLYGAEVAGKVHKELRRLGGVRPPREFVLMDRAAIGLGSVFMHLRANINWHRLFRGLVDDFDVKALEKRQRAALTKAGLPEEIAG
jgi:predicted unusual protein kinase regulating ubiquinone biosynthesis (AarF/ABC1/UbiB family)